MALRVLIVDDHPSFRASARLMLEAGGYDVVGEAADGAEAIASAARLEPELVLLDVQLPDTDGFEIVDELLGSSGRTTQVVLISSHDSTDLAEALEASGASGFVAKSELTAEAITSLIA